MTFNSRGNCVIKCGSSARSGRSCRGRRPGKLLKPTHRFIQLFDLFFGGEIRLCSERLNMWKSVSIIASLQKTCYEQNTVMTWKNLHKHTSSCKNSYQQSSCLRSSSSPISLLTYTDVSMYRIIKNTHHDVSHMMCHELSRFSSTIRGILSSSSYHHHPYP